MMLKIANSLQYVILASLSNGRSENDTSWVQKASDAMFTQTKRISWTIEQCCGQTTTKYSLQ